MKNRKRTRILVKWIIGVKVSEKEIKYLQDLFPSTEWKEGVLSMSNPSIYTLSARTIRYSFYIDHDRKRILKPVFNEIYFKWLEEEQRKGEFVNLNVNPIGFWGDTK